MHPRRRRVPPTLSSSERALLDQSLYAPIDSALKDLKTCSRRLRTVLVTFGDEIRILERLYYKGKNQHRAALFWKRVAEIRKFGGRLDGMGIYDVVESLRWSFFGEGSQQNSKLLKGPWSHFPNVDYAVFVLERLSACSSLVEKMHGRLMEAYRYFSLVMQSGVFIQLLLTLTAITSRMDTLTFEIQDVLRLTWSATHRILQTLNPSAVRKLHPFISLGVTSGTPLAPATVEPSSSRLDPDFMTPEDMGSSMTRQTLNVMPTPAGESGLSEPRLPPADYLPSATLGLAVRVVVERKAAVIPPTPTEAATKKPKRRKGDGTDRDKSVKRKKRDEIDDIFG